MTIEEAKSCIGTIELLRTLAYNIHGVMDVIDADNCEKIIQALSQEPICDRDCEHCTWTECPIEPCDDAISRDAVYRLVDDIIDNLCENSIDLGALESWGREQVMELPSVTQKSGKWLPVSERLPDNTDPVNITWVNHDPESYYADIKDKPFTATGHYCNGRWWWYSVTSQEYLDEYGHWDIAAMDDAIEVIAWMPLPKPYEPRERNDKG